MSIFIVIPCYKVKNKISKVIKNTLKFADKIIIVDDKCPQKTGNFVKKNIKNKKIIVLFNKQNLGVGGATMKGYKIALKLKAKIIIKMDGDDQMNPKYIPYLIKNVQNGEAGYCKGNRFYNFNVITKMPLIRLLGNIFLSIIGKFSTGYWNIFDFTNGYTAISHITLKKISLSNLSNNFFFETDLLCNLYLKNIRVLDVNIPAIYNDSKSNLVISNVFLYFLFGNILNFLKRIYEIYLKKNFLIKIIILLIITLFNYYYGLLNYQILFFIFIFLIIDFLNIPVRKNEY
jgi:dolichol-phosphate mannosyltransferase